MENKQESVAPESRDLALIELRRWEEETGEKASASEGNAWIDGFNAGRALRAGAPPQLAESKKLSSFTCDCGRELLVEGIVIGKKC